MTARNSTDPNSSSGDLEIDRVRGEVAVEPTSAENFVYRVEILGAWVSLLQRQGQPMEVFVPIQDAAELASEQGDSKAAFAAIDTGFETLNRMQALLNLPSVGRTVAEQRAPFCSVENRADWPVYGGNRSHTASSLESGPIEGRVAWTFPVGRAWYARPLVDGNLLHVSSPGLRHMMHTLDGTSGKLIRAVRHPRPEALERLRLGRGRLFAQPYRTPCAAGTPVRCGNSIVLAHLGAQSWDEGRRPLTWIDRETGEIRQQVTAGYADYRIGHAALAGNDRWLVHPDAETQLHGRPPRVIGHHRLVCRSAKSGNEEWSVHVGQVFAEPVIDDGQVIAATADGTVLCLNIEGASAQEGFGFSDRRRMAWMFQAAGAVNVAPWVDSEGVFFADNSGIVHRLDRVSGRLIWSSRLSTLEPRSFRFAATPTRVGSRLYVGTSGAELACFDIASGDLLWTETLPDWIRSKPLLLDDRIVVATLKGTVHAFVDLGDQARRCWESCVTEYPIFADLVAGPSGVLASGSDMNLYCVDPENGELLWTHAIMPRAKTPDGPVFSDDFASGGVCQSKPTASDGTVFVGSPARFLHALDVESGAEKWRFEVGAAISGAPAVADGLVLFGQQGGEEHFYAVESATGLPRWKQSLGWVWSSANIEGNLALVPGVDGHANAVELETGRIVWRYRTGMACHPEPPIEDGRAFFGSWDHHVYALEVATGKLLWKFNTGGTPDSGAPIAFGGRLFVPVGGKRLHCLDAASGAILWEYGIEDGCLNGSPALWDNRLFISVNIRAGTIPLVSRIRCLYASDGRPLWDTPGGGITGPVVADGHLYTASTSDAEFRCVEIRGGTPRPLWTCRMADRVFESVPALHRGRAFILAEDSRLYAFC